MPKTPAQAALDVLVGKAIAPPLKALGFRKTARTFRRTHGRCVQVVNLQASMSSTADLVKFTMNLGVFFPEVSANMASWQPRMGAAGPDVWSCHVWQRIGFLLPEHDDKWWILRADDDPRTLAADLEHALRTTALPWLESMSDFETARARAEKAQPDGHVAKAFALASAVPKS